MGRRRSCSSRGSSLRRGLWDSGSTFSGGCLRLSSFEISVPKGHIYYHYGNRSQKTILIMTLGTYKIPFCIHIHIYIYIYTYTYIHIYICLYIFLYYIISFHFISHIYIYTYNMDPLAFGASEGSGPHCEESSRPAARPSRQSQLTFMHRV